MNTYTNIIPNTITVLLLITTSPSYFIPIVTPSLTATITIFLIIIITTTASPSSSTARRSSSSAHSISNKFSTKKPRFFLLHRTCSGLLLVPILSKSITCKRLLHINCVGHQTRSNINQRNHFCSLAPLLMFSIPFFLILHGLLNPSVLSFPSLHCKLYRSFPKLEHQLKFSI